MFTRWLLLLVAFLPVQGDQHGPFDPGRFPASKFSIEQKRLSFGPLTIQLTQASPLRDATVDPQLIGCSAFVEVRRGSRLADARAYEGMLFDPALVLPKRQPLADYFLLVQAGNYEGRTIVVGRDGKIREIDGDRVAVDRADGWLISDLGLSEEGMVQIFDYRQDKLIFHGHSPEFKYRQIGHWYRWNNRLFVSLYGSSGETEEWDEVYLLDLESRAFLKSKVTLDFRLHADQLAYVPLDNVGACTFGGRTPR